MLYSARKGSGRSRRRSLGVWVVGLAAWGLAIGGATQAVAQTGVVASYTPVDVGTHRTMEECLSAISRIGQVTGNGWTVNAVQGAPTGWPSLPDTMRKTAIRCGSRYTVTDTAFKTYSLRWLAQLGLMMGRDAEVKALVAARMALHPTDTTARNSIEDTLMVVYKAVRRVDLATGILEDRLRRVSKLPDRVQAHQAFVSFADDLGDTVLARTHLTAILTEAEHTPPTERHVNFDALYNALERLNHKEPFDSLAQSTASYWAALRSFVVRANRLNNPKTQMDTSLTGVGQPAAKVVGDFWFRQGDHGKGGATPGPTPGRVCLVEYIRHNDIYDLSEAFDGWRSLSKRFPELELILVTQNIGHFGETLQPDPAKEAELIRQWVHDWHKIPGLLAVVREGPFFHLPEPDGRVIPQEDTSTFTKVAGKIQGGASQIAWVELVDRDGNVVDKGNVGMDNKKMEELIAATLRQRPRAVAPPR